MEQVKIETINKSLNHYNMLPEVNLTNNDILRNF